MTNLYSREAEEALIGCLLLDGEYEKVDGVVFREDFYLEELKKIYTAIALLHSNRNPITMQSVSIQLENFNELKEVGGPEYLAALQNSVHVSVNLDYYANEVRRMSSLRKVMAAGKAIQALAHETDKDLSVILEQAQKHVYDINNTYIQRRFSHISDSLGVAYTALIEAQKKEEASPRIQTPFRELNSILNGGFGASDLVIIAARPSIGKTAVALAMAKYASDKCVGIISLEMSSQQLATRLLLSQAKMDVSKAMTGNMTEEEIDALPMYIDQLNNSKIYIDDGMVSSVSELRAKARRMKMDHGLDILFIDYLQLMTSGGSAANRVQEISEISRGLKLLARELNIPIVALSQLSRGVEGRESKRPRLSDLRDSGAIEQDADVVMMLYRDDYYNSKTKQKNILEILVQKHRNGPLGDVEVYFNRDRQEFRDLYYGAQ